MPDLFKICFFMFVVILLTRFANIRLFFFLLGPDRFRHKLYWLRSFILHCSRSKKVLVCMCFQGEWDLITCDKSEIFLEFFRILFSYFFDWIGFGLYHIWLDVSFCFI